MLLQQYEYEEAAVRGGQQLLHSPFFQVLIALACDLRFDRYLRDLFLLRWTFRIWKCEFFDQGYLRVLTMDHAGRGFEDTVLQPERQQDLFREHGSQSRLPLM